MKRKAGIWIDTKKAVITFVDGEEIKQKEVFSDIESFRIAGGYGSSTPYAPQNATSESKFTEKKKLALRKYFGEILEKTKSCSDVYIFGPAEAKFGLEKTYRNSPKFRGVVTAVDTSDNLTANQMKAKVISHFSQ